MRAFLIFFFSLCLFSIDVSGQDKNVTVVRSSKGMYTETEGGIGNTSLRLGLTATNQLIAGVKKAKEWAIINKKYQKQFKKEVTRFWVMDKSTYQFHGYVQAFAQTAKLIFSGNSDGSSSFVIVVESPIGSSDFLEFSSYDEMTSFLKILQGQSARKEIDSIFK